MEKSFRIDSLPTDYLKNINEEKLNLAIEEANTSNMVICGTAQINILEQGFTKNILLYFIKEKEFKKKRVEFVNRIPALNKL